MNKITTIILHIITFFMLTSCVAEQKKYVIGVSQSSVDAWRLKLQKELVQASYFNDDVDVVLCNADFDVEKQCAQIDSLVDIGVDLLIVSPQENGKIAEHVSNAQKHDIPVIIFDKTIDIKEYTAFMGADNYKIGRLMGEYAVSRLGKRGNVVEISGERTSPPAMERHRGFTDALKSHPDIHIVGHEEGDWKEASGEKAMERIIRKLEKEDPNFMIDLVFGGNDRMALGARKAIDCYTKTHTNSAISHNKAGILYFGIDAVPGIGGGMEMVENGKLTASAIYPTQGGKLIDLALKILKGEPYQKYNDMETSIVTRDNAKVLLLQYKEVEHQDQNIKMMYAKVDNIIAKLNAQTTLLVTFICIFFVIGLLLIIVVRAYRTKNHLYKELQKKTEELYCEKGIVERQRDELEEQRDQLLDATSKEEEEEPTDVSADTDMATDDEIPKSDFMNRFLKVLDTRFSDPTLSVEEIGQELGMSRVQLYRKTKALTGKTPVEIIRIERLRRARHLLEDESLSIAEVAYRIGFSAPSYFTKCYREYYGIAPSDVKNDTNA